MPGLGYMSWVKLLVHRQSRGFSRSFTVFARHGIAIAGHAINAMPCPADKFAVMSRARFDKKVRELVRFCVENLLAPCPQSAVCGRRTNEM